MKILSIETSCDETSMAIIELEKSNKEISIKIRAHVIASQTKLHKKFGGVYPAMAKIAHKKIITKVLKNSFSEMAEDSKKNEWQNIKLNKVQKLELLEILEREPTVLKDLIKFTEKNKFPKIDLISVTKGPGLAMSLWVGLNFAKALSVVMNVPIVGENHMLGHLYSGLLPSTEQNKKLILNKIPTKFIGLLVSGGHTEIIKQDKNKIELLGTTQDDAVGEAFDKVARMLDLTYPGGPIISKLAEQARKENTQPIKFPMPMLNSKNLDFSYSGLKTAVMYHLKNNPVKGDNDKLSIALGFENSAIDILVIKTFQALEKHNIKDLFLGGGVSANKYLRKRISDEANKKNINVYYPNMDITGDNALMIGLASGLKYMDKKIKNEKDTLRADPNLDIA